MLTELNVGRCLGGTSRNIVPFVSNLSERKRAVICLSREDDRLSRVEAVVELTLIVVGVAGVIAGVMG
jgi:hypothetical protein